MRAVREGEAIAELQRDRHPQESEARTWLYWRVMAVLRRVLETALYCDDLQRTTAFYERLLSATPMLRTDRVVACRPTAVSCQVMTAAVPRTWRSRSTVTRLPGGSCTSLHWAFRSRVA